ncbi:MULTISPECIES: hypothetical protein [Rhizobium]|uniref:Uncharacterized protein n=2 Tax=Rhizobium TaxID=379 RepID=A0ABY8IGU8_9HYPH|nr:MULTISPECIES: hypothetical protein [Rhizobium]MBZ5786568.1 hypothetical protein [Rhizobium sp. VS19-DR121]QXZ79359.1 hypothetical protein J5274_05040 [Rhizobium sp. L51/94]TQX89514.1 hypothetical protein EQW76_07040 [Rhizobium sp. rho-13.1]WFS22838.1 hypothetical protein PR018_17240 [Rhizobium rhododendri]
MVLIAKVLAESPREVKGLPCHQRCCFLPDVDGKALDKAWSRTGEAREASGRRERQPFSARMRPPPTPIFA